nr:hypothetical protein [Verminephrobacter aporrectodeae]
MEHTASRIFQTAAFVRDLGQFVRLVRTAAGYDDLVDIGVHDQVGVVRHDGDLAPLLVALLHKSTFEDVPPQEH